MTKAWEQLDERLKKALGLHYAPIAITFSQARPEGVGPYEAEIPAPSEDGRTGKVSAGCVFWIKSTDRSFTTAPEDHYNCSVGSVTHGLKELNEVIQNEDVKSLLECNWVTPEEASQLPTVRERPHYITYAPLSQVPVEPEVILIRINAFQAMVIHDAFDEMPIAGKPQCHIIPIAKEQGQVAMSTGCMLSRVRTGMSPEEMTCAIPASRLEEVVSKLETRREANAAVASYANKDARRFAEA